MKVLGVIPARYASTRFPGKPLVNIQGKTMIQRVYEQAMKAKSLSKVIVATDDERIFNHIKSFNGEVMMTSNVHQSGTDRCAEVINKLSSEAFDAVVNIQGDEPFINSSQIDAVVEVLKKEQFMIATLVKRINVDVYANEMQSVIAMDEANRVIHNPNIVKAVFSSEGKALYFSRSPIPYLRNIPAEEWISKGEFYKHIGLYAYKSSVLKEIAQLPPSRLEQLESLEQLRWLENGYSIGIAETDLETIGIDTPEDLLKVKIENT